MTFHVDVSRQKSSFFLEILKSFDFVERIRVDEDTQLEIAAPALASNPLPADGKPSLSARFYGSLQSGMTIEEIDHQLQTLRNEWDRPTW
jgi:hypothetical protein